MKLRDLPFDSFARNSAFHAIQALSPAAATTLNMLTDVLSAPADIPHATSVLNVVCAALAAFERELHTPNARFRYISDSLKMLRLEFETGLGQGANPTELEHSLLRRLHLHAPYALCLTLRGLPEHQSEPFLVACGAEIAMGMAHGKAFARGYANDIRREVSPHHFGYRHDDTGPCKWRRSFVRKFRAAAKLFDDNGNPHPEGADGVRLFDMQAGFELSRKVRYSPPRRRQALLDRTTLSAPQVTAAALQLVERAEGGDPTALLTMIASITGVSIATALSMPIRTMLEGRDSVMILNARQWTIDTNLARLTPDAARPPPGAAIFREAAPVSAKPLPAVVARLLACRLAMRPGAATLGELLPGAATSGRQAAIDGDPSALKPSIARFLASIGPFAVGLGIERLTAALVCNDFALVPGSKLYYALAERGAVWDGATTLFAALGWGQPVALAAGPACGSRIVPARAAVAEWLSWMAAELQRLTPGRRCHVERLVAHHNAYARCCASVAVFLLAARESRRLPFTTCNLSPDAEFASFVDKRTGVIPGALWQPMSPLLRAQVRLWLAHCVAFERRLAKLGLPGNHGLMTMLRSFNGGEELPMFFAVPGPKLSPMALGSADLAKWWPEPYRFSTDFGRHFFETELRASGVASSRIDLVLRHLTQAVEPHCSSHGDSLRQAAEEICNAQDRLLGGLGFSPIPGLRSR